MGHAAAQHVLALGSAHGFLLELHLAVARPHGAVEELAIGGAAGVVGFVLEQAVAGVGARGGEVGAGFEVGVVGGGDDVDVLLGLRLLRFETEAGGARVVEGRECGGGVGWRVGFLVRVCGREGVCGFDIFDWA